MGHPADYYRILRVRYGADKSDIAASYKQLCKIYHPDVNSSPGSEEIMKQINIAYSTLSDDLKRRAYNTRYAAFYAPKTKRDKSYDADWENKQREMDDKRAFEAINSYFNALHSGEYEKAYRLLSGYDRRYVTVQSFCEWRKSVQKLFVIRDFKVRSGEGFTKAPSKDGKESTAKKHYITITEKNTVTQKTEEYQVTKFAVKEYGGWSVLLGYRDLGEIAKMFEDLSAEQEKSKMVRHWEEYCHETCRELDMLSLAGLLKESKRELYRYERYNQAVTVACFRVGTASENTSAGSFTDLVEVAAKTISASLRACDIPAYISKGVFAVLFVGLKKKHARMITQRIIDKLKKNALLELNMGVHADCSFTAYEGGPLEDYFDTFLKKEVK